MLVWWGVCPAYLFIMMAFTRERACFDRHYLLPDVSTQPALAWMFAGAYLLAYTWIAGAYALTVMRTGTILPSISDARHAWGGTWPRVLAMVALFLLENAPAEIWIRLARVTGCGY